MVDADQDGNWLKGTISPFFPPLHIDFSESFRIRKKRLKCNKTGDGKSRDTGVVCWTTWTGGTWLEFGGEGGVGGAAD